MSTISWGKPRIFVRPLTEQGAETGTWEEFATPAEGSTSIETTEGDKVEAKLEGGANEDVRYGAPNYALVFSVRDVAARVNPITDDNNTGTFKVILQPEDPTAIGFVLAKATCSLTPTWTAADGGATTFRFEALQPKDGKPLQKGVVSVSESSGSITSVTIA